MVVAIATCYLDLDSKNVSQALRLQDFFFATISHNPALRHQHNAFDLGNDIRQLMCNQNDSNPGASQQTHGFF
jgi:hypothetical protein